jgi:hypothetical protein
MLALGGGQGNRSFDNDFVSYVWPKWERMKIIRVFGEGSGPLGVGPDLSSVGSSIRESLGSIKTGYRPARSSFCKKGLPGHFSRNSYVLQRRLP